MPKQGSTHAGKTVTCHHGHPDDDYDDLDDEDMVTLTFEENGRYVRSPQGTDRFGNHVRGRFESSALRFDCPVCGRPHYVCPVCSDEDDNTPSGWVRGESTGDQIPCHNCNQEEVAERRRRGY